VVVSIGGWDDVAFSSAGPDAFEPLAVTDAAIVEFAGVPATSEFEMTSSFAWHDVGAKVLSSFTTAQALRLTSEFAGAFGELGGSAMAVVNFSVSGLADGQTKPVRIVGDFETSDIVINGLLELFVSLEQFGGGANWGANGVSGGPFDVTLELSNGTYSLQARIEAWAAHLCCSDPPPIDFVQGLSMTFTDLTPIATGCGDGGSCFGPQIGPWCDDSLCCTTVCDVLPTCCTIRWDDVCAAAATNACTIEPLSRPVRNPDNGHRLQLLSPSSWTYATEQATALGGELVTVRDAAENEWLRRWMGNQHGVPRTLWLGLHRPTASDPFVWRSGEAIDYTHWAPGQPTSGGGNAARLASGSGQWSNPVHFSTHGVVEYRHVACDSEAGDCMVANGTPGCAQSSCCNIICDELDPACCAIAWDATCAAWAASHCNPTVATGPFEYQSKWFYLLTPSAATEAQRFARSIGGDLATVENVQKLVFLYDTIRMSLAPWVRMWIGLTNEAVEGQFEWMDGSPVGFTNWGFGQPETAEEGAHFVWIDVDAMWYRTTNASSHLLHGVVEVQPQCGLPMIGDCFGPSPWPFCSDATCCESVCALVPTCCATSWDALCGHVATTVCVLPCPADFTGDGIVDGADLGLLLNAWSAGGGPFDLNGDGVIDGADLGILLSAWGACE